MTTPRIVRFAVGASSALTFALLSAQTTPSSVPAKDETVVLSPFTVSSSASGRYQATESTSGSRVRVSLFDSTQAVSVVTRDLIEDIGAGRIVDAAKYVAGVYESTIPNAQDRTTIRGFQNDGATIDGFSYFSFANVDPVLIDRIEVVKGPNAILAPQGIPGGTVNIVSKKPFFSDRGYVSGQVGLYSSSRAELDVNRVVTPGKLAFRFAGAFQDAEDYGDNNFHQGWVAMPMFTYRFGPGTELTVQAELYNWRALNYGGIPISLYANSTGNWRTLENIPFDYVLQRKDVNRHQSAQHYRAFLTANISDNLSMRIAANLIQSTGQSSQFNIGGATVQVTTTDPNTGLRVWDGVTRNDNPLFPLGGSINWQDRTYANFQHDFAYEVKGDSFKSTTVFGYAINFAGTYDEKNQNFTVPSPQALNAYVYTPYTMTNVTGINTRFFKDQQLYLNESLTLLKDRLTVNAGISRNWMFSQNYDKITALAVNRVTHKPTAWLPSAGFNFKITPDLAFFYGFSKQATAINPSVTSTNFFDTQTSKQHEFGLRARAFAGRLAATVSYFDIEQDNFSIPNPANSAVPVPSPLLPPLFFNRTAKGAEFELSFAVNQNFSIVGNATVMKNRDPDDMPFRGTAEKSGAVWLNYVFAKESSLHGLSAGLGVDYLSKRAGDNAGGATSASTPSKVIRVAPSFWLPARTLVNANLTYRFSKEWRAQLNLDNLLDEEYLQSSTGRQNVWVGLPFNAKLTVTRSF